MNQKNNRLEKAQNSPLQYKSQFARYCKEHNIPFSMDFSQVALDPNVNVDVDAFKKAYYLPKFLPNGLKERGASVMLVMESKLENNHGEVVATIADQVAANLIGIADTNVMPNEPDKSKTTIQIQRSINPAYRLAFENEGNEEIKRLMENNGAAVIVTSIGWNDSLLVMDEPHANDQLEHLWNISAFVVDSAGNDGRYGSDGKIEKPFQKHNGVTHGSALTVRVGAAKWDEKENNWVMEGYSSANGPTLSGVVHPEVNVNWGNSDINDPKKKLPPAKVTGTSASNPWVGGMLNAFNNEFGQYLTREQILYGILSTADKPSKVEAYEKKTPKDEALSYVENAAGLTFDPVYAGFGVPNIGKAEKLLAHMVEYAQTHPEQITIAKEESTKKSYPKEEKQEPNSDGLYEYSLEQEAGLSLRTTFSLLFSEERGEVTVTSPSGTAIPLTLSIGEDKKNEEALINRFSISTTEGFAGESTEGKWTIQSTTPIETLKLRSYNMRENDLIKAVRYEDIAEKPIPNLSNAKPLDELIDIQSTWEIRERKRSHEGALVINDHHPNLSDPNEIVEMLRFAPEGIPNNARTRQNTFLRYNMEGEAGAMEAQAYAAQAAFAGSADVSDLMQAAEAYQQAAALYEDVGNKMPAANMFSLAAQAFRKFTHNDVHEDRVYSDHAVALFDKAIALHQEQGHVDLEFRDRNALFDAIIDSYETYMFMAENKPENPEKWREKANALQGRIATESALLLQNGQSIQGVHDPDAIRVEQCCLGFSDDKPIGTDNISQCLTVIAQQKPPTNPMDSHDKTVGLAHIDYETDLKTLDKLFERLPEGTKQVRVVGARFDRDPKSVENIVNVIRKMSEYNVEIISSDVLSGNAGVSAVVVNPADFSIKEAVPMEKNPNFSVANAHVLLRAYEEEDPLHVSFDLTQSDKRAPVLLDANKVALLRDAYMNRNTLEQYKSLREQGLEDRGLALNYIAGIVDEYESSLKAAKDYLQSIAGSVTVEETTLDGEKMQSPLIDRDGAMKLLERSALYVGENSEQLNKQTIDTMVKYLEVRQDQIEVKQSVAHLIAPSSDAYSELTKDIEKSDSFTDRINKNTPPSQSK